MVFKVGWISKGILISIESSIRLTRWLFTELDIWIFPPFNASFALHTWYSDGFWILDFEMKNLIWRRNSNGKVGDQSFVCF